MARKLLISCSILVIGALGIVYGPAIASFAIIPPRFGVYRCYRTTLDGWHWRYLFLRDGHVVSADYRENDFTEDWDFVRGAGGEFLLYDYRGEFDGILTPTHGSLVLHDLDGREERYARVFDLWEIWRENPLAHGRQRTWRALADRKRAYSEMIERRMKEQGLTVPPAARAAHRPTVITRREDKATSRPLVSVVETYGLFSRPETTFVLYEDGKMICRTQGLGLDEPYHILQGPSGQQAKQEVFPFDTGMLADRYVLSAATDQPEAFLWISGKAITIYGPWRKPTEFTSETEDDRSKDLDAQERKMWESLPAPLRMALQRIDEFRAAKGPPWLPGKIEVRFSDFEYSRDEPILWPKRWPGLYDPGSVKHDEGSYSVFVPSADYAQLRAFLDTWNERSAVMIDLNKMAPNLRFPIPGESAWRK